MNHFAPGSIPVLIVEDSPQVAAFLRSVLSSDPAIRVVGVAAGGQQAVEATRRLRPAVITMDVHMPHVDGYEATRRIMETCPTPIVIVTGYAGDGGMERGHAVAAGAVAMVPQPPEPGHPRHDDVARQLIDTVKLMSEVKVVRRWRRVASPDAATPAAASAQPSTAALPARRKAQLVAIGASTGGPPVLQTILRRLPRELPVPVLIVQHMAVGFAEAFTEWLADTTGFPVHLAEHGEVMLPGHAYVAPDDKHMAVGRDLRLHLSTAPPLNSVRPAVSFLFRSLTNAMAPHVVAVLLTGMGRDGVDEMKRLHDAGALTLAQDEKSSVVFGMPGQAVLAGAVTHVLPPEGIADVLAHLERTG